MFKNFKKIATLTLSLALTFTVTTSIQASPYKICDEYNATFEQMFPQFMTTHQYLIQGVNTYGYHGTCSEASEANAMNLLFDTDYTEQDFVDLAYKSGMCTTTSPDPYINGGQSAVQMVNVIQQMGSQTNHPVTAKYLVTKDTPNAVQCAEYLNNGSAIIIGVSSSMLWSGVPTYAYGDFGQYVVNDHWITLKAPKYDENNNLIGFDILDSSGSGKIYITLKEFNDCVFGPNNDIIYNTCVVITKNEPESQVKSIETNKDSKDSKANTNNNSTKKNGNKSAKTNTGKTNTSKANKANTNKTTKTNTNKTMKSSTSK